MTILEAYAHFVMMDHDDWNIPFPQKFHNHCYMPAILTAAAELSGGLEDAQTGIDLTELVHHTSTLLDIGIVDIDQWVEEANSIEEEFLLAGVEAERIELARQQQ